MSLPSTICARLYDLARSRNGENVTVRLNNVDVLIIQRLEEADHILRLNAGNYLKNMAWFRQVLGASRFSEDGEAWSIRRVLTQAYFNKFDREKTFSLSARYAQSALETLTGGSARIDDNVLRTMTASILVDNFFGVDFDRTGIDLALLAELMERGSEYSFVPAGTAGETHRQSLMTLPQLRRRVLETLGYFRGKDVPRTPLLDGLLKADVRSEKRVVLEHELMTFMAAGAETSAATMSWACYLLARHPDLQARLRGVAQAFWREEEPSWKRLATLKPLAAFISETLRLYPPTPIVSRFAIEPDQLGDIRIDAGQKVVISFVGIQHDERFRPSPWSIDIDAEANTRIEGDAMAFSIGPRVCGGKHFALVELVTFLSVFLDKAGFELTSDAEPVFRWKSQMLREGGQPVRMNWLEKQ